MLLITLYQMRSVQKGKSNNERSCQSISFFLKTNFVRSTTTYEDEGACLWKQLKWNKFPFYGDGRSGEKFHQG